MGEWLVSGAIRTNNTYPVLSLIMGSLQQPPKNSKNKSDIKDHKSQSTFTNITAMKIFEMLQKLPKSDTET